MMTNQGLEFIVQRDQLTHCKSRKLDFPDQQTLATGQVLLKIDHFAFTSNNVTYAAFGTAMKYWNFFPTETGWGNIPVWGFADVLLSNVDGIEPGERFYGYYPMASHLLVTPSRINVNGFSDSAAHRQEMHPLYNQYLRTTTDPAYQKDTEALQMLLRPLFITSLMIDDFLDDNQFFGAKNVIISSASSKTAYGLAFALSQRAARDYQIIGLTSEANRQFVTNLGIYDQVLNYEQCGQLDASVASVYVDMAGSASLRSEIHHHLSDNVVYSCAVGGTHWEDLGSGQHLPGARPSLFFAPAQIKKRLADWGSAGLQSKLADAWQKLILRITDAQHPWLQVSHSYGADASNQLVLKMLSGKVAAQEGHILSLSRSS
ncbi:DUF2855 family protein [Undibacterium jejuense]|nr:DUF2855 family protein [Undibacterium jejuense]